MSLTICTWNINSIRIRLDLLRTVVETLKPDVLCLQETKCQDSQFPMKAVRELGFAHVALNGQKGWHGVATLSRHPFTAIDRGDFCEKGEARHVSVTLGADAGLDKPVRVHNFYVPAGGDEPDVEINPKFAHKLAFLDQMAASPALHADGAAQDHYAVLVGDLNIAPLETDVWNHRQLLKVVSHTPVEVEKLEAARAASGWVDTMRRIVPPQDKLFTWWSYRSKDFRQHDRGRRLDHVWSNPALAAHARTMTVLTDARGWERPSDHVPVALTFG